ncbi:hypothetical protein SLS62_001043 [Diatrype stigma]|uniref:Branched-chain-amino-acid aminotransferase n=1 Tax=Diatrype stigma TaxID=117547 RepID=A0AAN9V258_9PEZI
MYHLVNGHIESIYSRTTGKWSPLTFVSDPHVRIHGLSPALNYGQQVLEGLKAFRMPGDAGGIALFRPDRHAARFRHSAAVLSLPPVPADTFMRACRAAVARNAQYVPPHGSGGALYVRPQLYGSSAMFKLAAPAECAFRVFVLPTGGTHHDHGTAAPVKALILDRFDRAAPLGTGHAKVGGNYAPVLRWSDQAGREGFGITLHLDSARHETVDEFSTCGFVGVISPRRDDDDGDDKDVTLVVPDSACAINSVTSDSIQRIGRSFGWDVEKRPVRYAELPSFDEVLGAGTAVALIPIRSITRERTAGVSVVSGPRVQVDAETETISYLSDEQQSGGPVYLKLLARLLAIQQGKVWDEFGWRFEVKAEDRDVPGRNENIDNR